MYKIRIAFLFFFPAIFFGQNMTFKIDSLLFKKITILNAEKIGFTRKSCTGFGVASEAYLFWNADSKIMMQKIEFIEYPKEHLKEYKPIILKDDFFFKNFLKNKQELLSESEIKRFQLDVKKVKQNRTVSTSFPLTSHSCYRLIQVQTQNMNFSENFDYFKLVKSLGNSDDKVNINFDFNKNLEIVKFDYLINTHIEKIEISTDLELITQE